MNRFVRFILVSVVLVFVIGIAGEIIAPVIDQKYKLTDLVSSLLNVEQKITNESKKQKDYLFETINVKSSNGMPFKIPDSCTLEYRERPSEKLFSKDLKDKDHTLSSKHKLNKTIEIAESVETETTDIISCNDTDAFWNILIGKFPEMGSINSSNIMEACVTFGESINLMTDGKSRLIKCELENSTIGSNNMFIEFDVSNDKTHGSYKRFGYNFYYNNFFYNIIGQCHINGSNDCKYVSRVTSLIAESFGK
jgi:hypothetical protein